MWPYCFLIWEGWHHLLAVLHLRCSSPLCSLSCHPHRFFLLCQSGGFAALLLPYLGGVASKVIFISLFYLFLCTTLVLVYLAWSPWVYLDIHIRGYIIFWWPSYCLWLKFQSTMQHSTLGYRALIQPTTILVYKVALNTQPSWLGVCVYLLKRSKTCTWSLRNSHEALVYYFKMQGGKASSDDLA